MKPVDFMFSPIRFAFEFTLLMLTSAFTFASAPVPRASFVDHLRAPAMAFIESCSTSTLVVVL